MGDSERRDPRFLVSRLRFCGVPVFNLHLKKGVVMETGLRLLCTAKKVHFRS